jgi:hypothetical protein
MSLHKKREIVFQKCTVLCMICFQDLSVHRYLQLREQRAGQDLGEATSLVSLPRWLLMNMAEVAC